MLTIAGKVEQLVADSTFLTEGLARGLLNLSELARQIQPQLETDLWKPVGQAAVVMALRRLAERLPPWQSSELSLSAPAPGGGEFTTRSGLTEFTYRYTERSYACQHQLLAQAAPQLGLFVTVTRGVNEVVVICSQPLVAVVEQVFFGEPQLARLESLAAVTLHLSPSGGARPGIDRAVLERLARVRIRLVNMMCTHTELTLLLEQAQTGAALSVLARVAAR